MIDRKIIFFPQNANQEKNFILLADDLVKKNFIKSKNIIFIDINNAFGKDEIISRRYEIIKIRWTCTIPIYSMGYTQRFINILLNQTKIKQCSIIDNNIIIIGNNGTIQRLLINKFHPKKFFYIVDTAVSNKIRRNKFIEIIFKVFSEIKLSHFVPGVNYHTPANGIFVSDDYYKNILQKNKVSSEVIVIDMPIHKKQYLDFISKQKKRNITDNTNLLYVTSAYKWHRKYDEHVFQQDDIYDLIHYCKQTKNINLRIRVHPREVYADYKWIEEMNSEKINITYGNDLPEDLSWCDKLVTCISSVGVEAQKLGIPTYIYVKNFGRSYIQGTIFDKGFKIINNVNETENHISRQLDNNYDRESDLEEIFNRLV